MSIWRAIGHQLANPTGAGGRLTGNLMRVANDRPNRLAIDALRIGPRDAVLELGFGPGHAIQLMAAQATSGVVYGVDRSPIMLEQAEKRNSAFIQQGRVFLYQAEFERLPFENASIDKILAVNVIYFWRDVPAVLKEMRRVLRPGGRVSIYATDAATMRRWKFAAPDTHRLYGAGELSAALRQGGLDNCQIFVSNISVIGGIQGLLATISLCGRAPEASLS